MSKPPFKLHPLTILGLVLFIGGIIGVVTSLIPLLGPTAPPEPGQLTRLVVSAAVQFTGYVLLNRNRFRNRKNTKR
ncbi:hypothetical protein IQ22_01663 [Pseudomonas duriflava]|uniref:Uncharacterized protein n=1 Tax=Pseudomonas duriflava TaxID=459528 RepID=A0A562QHQ8_9PSED|nr:hypothetical protein [Pseudomonas duriflava]TWI55730.1 hypothetical protein IQ22_01663 [Pseudomonas duriflava]